MAGGKADDETQPAPSRDLEENQRAEIAELQHRLRNVLAVIRSIARRTAATSQDIDDYAMNFDGRLNAYSRTLSLLTRGQKAGVGLEFLLAEELLSAQARDGDQVTISGPAVVLRAKAAETIGLAIHELVTNAVKHGALSYKAGKIDVVWEVESTAQGDELVLHWRESGGRRLNPVPTRRGFGVEILEETLPFDLKARTDLSFESTGFRCTIRFPLGGQISLGSSRN